ncbi:MAG TPA: carboxypeptidase-like regulatory domain-containing protein [Gemmatimonadaceae bacterium]|nr:carboxypeptidase-like regulatory domain-containing protein [Gemmatimonadaceae bacterium]
MSLSRVVVALAALFVLAALRPAAIRAQDPDIIRGRVTGPDSLPVEGAAVSVTAIASGVNKTARTDKDGRFTVTFPSADGDYWVAIQSIGLAARRFEIKRLADEDVLIADVRLAKPLTILGAVRIQGQRPPPSRDAGGTDISGTERAVSSTGLDLSALGDLAALAGTLPGVTLIPSADGGPAGFSVFGLDAAANSFMLNGLAMNGSTLPRDAAVSTTVATSPYDVSRGGFSGGQVTTRSQSGGNYIVRSMSITGITPQMQWTDRAAQSLALASTNASVSGRFSGPIKLNRAFYNLAYQFDDNTRDLRTLLDIDATGLQAVGISQDSVERLQEVLSGQGLPYSVNGFPNANKQERGSLLGSFDFTPNSSQGHSFNLTVNGNWGRSLPMGFNSWDSPAHAGRSSNWAGSVQARHTAYLKSIILSTTSIGYSENANESSPYLSLPSASVLIASDFPDGSSNIRSILVGGNASLGSRSSTTNLQFRNALSWLSMDGSHKLTLTTELARNLALTDQLSNMYGSFSFNSLADFEAGRPASFSRTLTPRRQGRSQGTLGMSLGDAWRPNPDLNLTYGVRVDASKFGSGPEYNPLVEQVFGLRNDRVPNPISLSPRLGFSKSFGEAPQITMGEGFMRGPRQRIAGGLGIFQGSPAQSLMSRVISNTGLPSAIQQLTCIGDAAPTPDWERYRLDPTTVPGACTDGSTGTVFANAQPGVTLVDPNYHASRRLSADLNWNGWVLNNRFNLNVAGSYALNLDQQGEIDLNFAPNVRFNLAGEGGRPVFVDPASVVPTTGSIASGDARVSQSFSRVTFINSNLRSDSKQLIFRVSPTSFNSNFTWNASYTRSWNRRLVQGFSSTVGNPLDRQWGDNDLNAKHQVQLSLNYNLLNTLRLNWSISARSGVPITPRIAGDVNGDGYSNDRAFIFDPAHTADSALASQMRQVLDDGSPIARDCLGRQVRQLAKLASCRGPWTLSGNNAINITVNPLKVRMPQRAQLRFQLGNPLGALDLALHGSGNVRGWGQSLSPDQTLLYVRGFDPETKQFKYEVNQRFGSTRPQQSVVRGSPVTMTALLSIDLGPSRERQSLTQMLDRGRKYKDQQKQNELSIKGMYSSGGMPNPMTTMLRQADQLKLTPEQADSIATLNRWLTIGLDSIWSPVAKDLAALPELYDQGAAYDRYRAAREASFDLLIRVAPDVVRMLTAEQKRLLPSSVANYLDVKYLRQNRSSTSGGGGYY